MKICGKSEVVNKSVECESWQTSKVVVVDRKKGSGARNLLCNVGAIEAEEVTCCKRLTNVGGRNRCSEERQVVQLPPTKPTKEANLCQTEHDFRRMKKKSIHVCD